MISASSTKCQALNGPHCCACSCSVSMGFLGLDTLFVIQGIIPLPFRQLVFIEHVWITMSFTFLKTKIKPVFLSSKKSSWFSDLSPAYLELPCFTASSAPASVQLSEAIEKHTAPLAALALNSLAIVLMGSPCYSVKPTYSWSAQALTLLCQCFLVPSAETTFLLLLWTDNLVSSFI